MDAVMRMVRENFPGPLKPKGPGREPWSGGPHWTAAEKGQLEAGQKSSCCTRGGMGSGGRCQEQEDERLPRNRYANASISDFTSKKEIGSGRNAVIFAARCRATGRRVALKAYLRRGLTTPDLHRVRREIAILRMLGHEHIIAYYGHFEDDRWLYLVQEWAARGDLFEELRRLGGIMAEGRAVTQVLWPLLRALHHMHSRGVLHRDLKPENILVTAAGDIKVADFGLAINASVERPSSRLGTLQYMAPEVVSRPCVRSRAMAAMPAYDEKVDIWACGVLVYEMVMGRAPFEDPSDEVTTQQILHHSLERLPDCMSAHCQDFIRKVLRKKASERLSLEEMMQHPFVTSHIWPELTQRTPRPIPTSPVPSFGPPPSTAQRDSAARGAHMKPAQVAPLDWEAGGTLVPEPSHSTPEEVELCPKGVCGKQSHGEASLGKGLPGKEVSQKMVPGESPLGCVGVNETKKTSHGATQRLGAARHEGSLARATGESTNQTRENQCMSKGVGRLQPMEVGSATSPARNQAANEKQDSPETRGLSMSLPLPDDNQDASCQDWLTGISREHAASFPLAKGSQADGSEVEAYGEGFALANNVRDWVTRKTENSEWSIGALQLITEGSGKFSLETGSTESPPSSPLSPLLLSGVHWDATSYEKPVGAQINGDWWAAETFQQLPGKQEAAMGALIRSAAKHVSDVDIGEEYAAMAKEVSQQVTCTGQSGRVFGWSDRDPEPARPGQKLQCPQGSPGSAANDPIPAAGASANQVSLATASSHDVVSTAKPPMLDIHSLRKTCSPPASKSPSGRHLPGRAVLSPIYPRKCMAVDQTSPSTVRETPGSAHTVAKLPGGILGANDLANRRPEGMCSSERMEPQGRAEAAVGEEQGEDQIRARPWLTNLLSAVSQNPRSGDP